MTDKRVTHYALPVEFAERLHKFLMGLPYGQVAPIVDEYRKGQNIHIEIPEQNQEDLKIRK